MSARDLFGDWWPVWEPFIAACREAARALDAFGEAWRRIQPPDEERT